MLHYMPSVVPRSMRLRLRREYSQSKQSPKGCLWLLWERKLVSLEMALVGGGAARTVDLAGCAKLGRNRGEGGLRVLAYICNCSKTHNDD